MRAVLIPTGGMPEEIDLRPDTAGSTYRQLQEYVGGYLDVLAGLLGEGVDLYVNDEGVSTCRPNRALYATGPMEEAGYLSQMDFRTVVREGDLYTVLFGDIVAVGLDPEDGGSRGLTDAELAFVTDYFASTSGPLSGEITCIAMQAGFTSPVELGLNGVIGGAIAANYERVGDWYRRTYPDGSGGEIDPGMTFADALDLVSTGGDSYEELDAWDPVTRERVFVELAERYGIELGEIREAWADRRGVDLSAEPPEAHEAADEQREPNHARRGR